MAATEPERLALHAAARATLGEQEGDTLMAITAPANTDIATKQDLEVVEARLTASHIRSTLVIVGSIQTIALAYLTVLAMMLR